MGKKTINVVGAGLAGSLAARVLRARGHDVRVFDAGDKYSASQASSNLFIAHWLKKFSAKEAANGVRILEELFPGQIDLPFAQGLGYAMTVRHIAQRHVLVKPNVHETVVPFHGKLVGVVSETEWDGPILLCRGYREPDLDVTVKVGHCFLFRGRLPEGKSRIAIISPYRHEKFYQFDDNTIYYADSVAVAYKTYKKRESEYKATTFERARNHLYDLDIPVDVVDFRIGYRPIMKGHDFGKLTKHKNNIWSINGGGKNGLVAYADLAEKFAEEIA